MANFAARTAVNKQRKMEKARVIYGAIGLDSGRRDAFIADFYDRAHELLGVVAFRGRTPEHIVRAGGIFDNMVRQIGEYRAELIDLAGQEPQPVFAHLLSDNSRFIPPQIVDLQAFNEGNLPFCFADAGLRVVSLAREAAARILPVMGLDDWTREDLKSLFVEPRYLDKIRPMIDFVAFGRIYRLTDQFRGLAAAEPAPAAAAVGNDQAPVGRRGRPALAAPVI